MEKFDITLHKPGVVIYRAKGNLSTDDVEKWREELLKFVKENDKRGACGVLIDVCEVESFSAEGLDALMELLADPEEIIRNMHMRFALIGVKPYTQRFLRETMPIEEIKHIRGRFFHEVAEDEALAWLQAMVTTAEEQVETKVAEPVEPKKEEAKKPPEPPQSKDVEKKPDEKEPEKREPDKKEPEKKEPEKKEPEKKEPEKKEPEKKPEPMRLIPTLLKGRIKPEEKK
jgi:anti-anti-sigma regulatory factor